MSNFKIDSNIIVNDVFYLICLFWDISKSSFSSLSW